jgi:hypothetical protein
LKWLVIHLRFGLDLHRVQYKLLNTVEAKSEINQLPIQDSPASLAKC